MGALQANGISIEVEQYGRGDGAPLLLVAGLGAQLISWHESVIEGFTANGFRVIAFDNRDAGWSQKFDAWGAPDLDEMERLLAAGEKPALPYTLEDMAADGIGVLDALGIGCAHVVGKSMGGMIAQLMAAGYPARVLSMTSIVSSSGNPELPRRRPEVQALLLGGPDDPGDRSQAIEFALAGDRAWGSPAYPFDEAERRAYLERCYDRCHCPDGALRQYAAVRADGSRVERLRTVTAPCLVIQGAADTLLGVEHGRDIAANVTGAELMVIEGMGHDLEGDTRRMVVDAVTRLARRAGTPDA